MNRISTLIIDDNDANVEKLKGLFSSYFPDVDLIRVEKDVDSAYTFILQTGPQLVIVDIELILRTDFEFLEKLSTVDGIQIIACTNNKNQTLISQDHRIAAILHKPYGLEELLIAVNQVRKELALISPIIRSEQGTDSFPKFLALTSLTEAIVVKPKDIQYLKAEGRYTSVVLKDGKTMLISRNLGAFEKLLDSTVFYRVHHSYVINLNEVLSLNRPKTTFCLMRTGVNIPVSARKSSLLLSYLHLKD